MAPTIKQRDWPHLYVSTMCPLCKEGGHWPDEVWLGSCDNGLFRLNRNAAEWVQFLSASNYIGDVAVTSEGVLWVAVDEEALYSYDGVNWTTHAVDASSPYTSGPVSIKDVCLCPDAVGGIWLGYGDYAHGVSYYDGATWTYYSGLGTNDHTTAISVAPNGYVWFLQSFDTVISYYTGTGWLTADLPGGASVYGYSIDIASDGVIWIGSWLTIYKYDLTTWTTFTTSGAEGLTGRLFSAIVSDGAGNAWVGAGLTTFLQYFDGATWTVANAAGITSRTPAVEIDAEGTVWVGTYYDGVWKYEGSVWVQYTHDNSGFDSPTDNMFAHHIVVTSPGTPERLARDAQAWREHLIRCHGAPGGMAASHWENTGIYGDDEGRWDTREGWQHRFANTCYACGQSFQTNTLLVTHITTIHLEQVSLEE